jgi:hypothetical protein
MKRRWKVLFALGGVGLAGFLIWAFRSDPNRGVAIRFMGYETSVPGLRMADKTARFCLTNGSQRVIYCESMGGIPSCGVESKSAQGWSVEFVSRGDGSSVAGMISLPPGGTSCFALDVLSSDRPFRVTVPYSTNSVPEIYRMLLKLAAKPTPTPVIIKLKNRVSSWFHLGEEKTSVSITIQDR